MKKNICKFILLFLISIFFLLNTCFSIFALEKENTDESKIIDTMQNMFLRLKDGDINSFFQNVIIDEEKVIDKNVINNVENFFKTYPDCKRTLINFMKKTELEVIDIKKEEDYFIVKSKITIPNIESLTLSIAPKFAFKYGSKILSKKFVINNEVLNDISEMLNQALEKTKGVEEFTYDFKFVKVSDDYYLDFSNIEKSIREYINKFTAKMPLGL